MKEKIIERFDELIAQGHEFVSIIGRDERGRPYYYINKNKLPEYQAWLSSSINFIESIVPENSNYSKEYKSIMSVENLQHGIPSHVIQKTLGILISIKNELSKGFLQKIEYIYVAETFDNFLEHADKYHRSNKKIEASVLASFVLEDIMKKIAKKNSIDSNRTLDPIIDDLKKAGVFNTPKAKRIKSYADIRNKAFHANWEEFDVKDIGDMIEGIRLLIEDYL